DLVGHVPQKWIGQRVTEEGAEHCGDKAPADDPGKRDRHYQMRAEEWGDGGEHAGGEAEGNRMRGRAKPTQAIDHVAARAAPALTRPEMGPRLGPPALCHSAFEQHYIPNQPRFCSMTRACDSRPTFMRLIRARLLMNFTH